MTDLDLMLRFLLQVVVVLGVCKGAGWLGKRYLGQTHVVMEMVAGILLGPSLFGLLAPKLQTWLFPLNSTYVVDGVSKTARHPSMFILYVAAQLGLILYMFLVGLEFNTKILRNRVKGAVSVSAVGIAAPFILGAIIALFTHEGWGLFAPHISVGAACLYFGAAMCITSFPVLSRIIFERGIAGTAMGTLALGAAAAGDAIAWGLLAVVLALAKGTWSYAAFAIGGGVVFCVLVLKYVGKLFEKLASEVERDGELPQSAFVTLMIVLFAAAFVTDAIGIYSVFGAFILGVSLPRGRFAQEIRQKLESLTVGVLLPFFFVYSGLCTQVALIDTWGTALLALVVISVAVIGKAVPCALAARASGESWRESWAIGTLMNARGLMELILLNIGLQAGVITARLYTIMVLMALLTTLMTSPIFKWIFNRYLGHLAVEGNGSTPEPA